ncbi:MAG: VanW family protein [Ignavibacteriales bacterium]
MIVTTAYAAWLDKMERKWYGVKPGVWLEDHLVEGFLSQEIDIVIDELVAKHRRPPQNVRLDRESGQIIKEKFGCEVDIQQTKQKVMQAGPNQKLSLITNQILPMHTAAELENVDRPIGTYSTWFYGSWQRHQNIELALRSINNTIIWPKKRFSFNETVGPRTPERGYSPAPVIGGDGLGFGGGVCQVSSTLYNAALEAKLLVIARYPHSSPVHYVPKGKDATVVYGAQDLVLENNYDYPVIIQGVIYRGKITVSIKGK